jgi:hypothetical protein
VRFVSIAGEVSIRVSRAPLRRAEADVSGNPPTLEWHFRSVVGPIPFAVTGLQLHSETNDRYQHPAAVAAHLASTNPTVADCSAEGGAHHRKATLQRSNTAQIVVWLLRPCPPWHGPCRGPYSYPLRRDLPRPRVPCASLTPPLSFVGSVAALLCRRRPPPRGPRPCAPKSGDACSP